MTATYEQQQLARRLFRATYSTFRLNVRMTTAAHAIGGLWNYLPHPFRLSRSTDIVERTAQAALAAWRWQRGRTGRNTDGLSDTKRMLHLATRDQHFRNQQSKSQRRAADQYRWEAENWLRDLDD